MVPCLNRQAVQIQDVIASPFYMCCITTSFYFGFPVERRVSTASEYVNVEGILDRYLFRFRSTMRDTSGFLAKSCLPRVLLDKNVIQESASSVPA